MMMLKGLFGHLKVVMRHRRKVMAHCRKAGILWQGIGHDLSKYAPTEFWAGVKYYQGFRSPNDAQREEKGFSAAWMHHKGRNRHHFEYWTDYDAKTRQIVPIEMPKKYVAEMFCDRLAASKIYNGRHYTDRHPLDYFVKAKGVRVIHPATSELLEHLLTLVAEQGEDVAFEAVRVMLKEERP